MFSSSILSFPISSFPLSGEQNQRSFQVKAIYSAAIFVSEQLFFRPERPTLEWGSTEIAGNTLV